MPACNKKMDIELNDTESEIYRLAQPCLLTVRQDDLHVWNALEFALRLLEVEPGDRAIVVPAVILHDTGWSRVPADMVAEAFGPEADVGLTRLHEAEGVKIAAGILKTVGYDSARAAEVIHIIDGHDTRPEPLSLNDKIVKDADKLTRYAKCFPIFASVLGLSLREYRDILVARGEHWFFLPASRGMAGAALRQWARQIESE